MATIASVPGRENQFVVTLSRGDKAIILDGVERHNIPLNWFDDPIAELADRLCAPVEAVYCPEPNFSGPTLDVFEVSLTDAGVEPYEPFYVVPYQSVTAEELECEFNCYACWRAVPDPTGNEWESIDGVGYALVPEQGTLYVISRDLVRKVGEVFAEKVHEEVMDFLEHGCIPFRHSQREFVDVVAVKESFIAMYFDE